MSEHGFLQPNPALFDLEKRLAGRTGPRLAHQLGEGAECVKCGDRCPGFQLHFWRKVCLNCRCGKGEHNVREETDHGVSFVGKIFDRPLRTRAEECKFIYGEVVEEGEGAEQFSTGQEVMLDWAPPGVSSTVATKYLRALPEGHLSIQGSEGAMRRKRQLEKQFPLHDVEPKSCHELTEGEIDTMTTYVDNVKKNIAGQGIVQELEEKDDLSRMPWGLSHDRDDLTRVTPSPPPPLPPPPMELLSADTSSYTLSSPTQPPLGTFYAAPGYSGDYISSGQQNKPRVATSTGSSVTSTPSPPPDVGRTVKVWSCAGCGEEMNPGSVAIFAERAGKDRCWHPSCFCCSSCGDLLEDLLYFYSRGQLYCGRDFANLMNIPRCGACDELIFATEYTGAEDKLWHVKHFCCYVCDTPLAGHKYIPVEGQPHCLACWQRDYGKVCNSCGGVIDPQGQRVSLGTDNWHATEECFRCGVCSKSLLGGKMSRRSGTLLCSSQCGQELARRGSAVPPSSRGSSAVKLQKQSAALNQEHGLQSNAETGHLRGLRSPSGHQLGQSKSPLVSPSHPQGRQSPAEGMKSPSPPFLGLQYPSPPHLGHQSPSHPRPPPSPLSSHHSNSSSSLSSGHGSLYSSRDSQALNQTHVPFNRSQAPFSQSQVPFSQNQVPFSQTHVPFNKSNTAVDKSNVPLDKSYRKVENKSHMLFENKSNLSHENMSYLQINNTDPVGYSSTSPGPPRYSSQGPYTPHGGAYTHPSKGPFRDQTSDMAVTQQGRHSRAGSYSTIV